MTEHSLARERSPIRKYVDNDLHENSAIRTLEYTVQHKRFTTEPAVVAAMVLTVAVTVASTAAAAADGRWVISTTELLSLPLPLLRYSLSSFINHSLTTSHTHTQSLSDRPGLQLTHILHGPMPSQSRYHTWTRSLSLPCHNGWDHVSPKNTPRAEASVW